MSNQTHATVRRGDTCASFPVSLPRSNGISSVNKRHRATPANLLCTGQAGNIDYSVFYRAELDKRTASFSVMTGARQRTSAQDMDRKMQGHFADIGSKFPLLHPRLLPRIEYDDEMVHAERFQLVLPPRTAIYSTSELFFPSLGFRDHPNLRVLWKQVGNRPTTAQTRVYGFYNASETDSFIVESTEIMPPKMTMAERLGDGAVFPNQMGVQLQMERLNFRELYLANNEGLNVPVNLTEAVNHLTLLLEQARIAAGLTMNLIDVVAGTGNTIYLTNRVFPEGGVSLTLFFPIQVSRALGLRDMQVLNFNFDVVRTFELNVKDKVPDPFQGRYPVHAVMCGFGEANSYLEGVGTVPIFATLIEGRKKPLSDGAVIQNDRTYLTLEFRDREGERIAFQDAYVISMLLNFKSF